ncbi:DUF309 domain-containing protein [Sulfitobacter sp. LCG007]
MPEPAGSAPLRPPFAHVPGRNARHPEGRFDAVKDSVEGVSLDVLHRTQAFRTGLIWLEEGYYWECHEVLEPVWMRTPDPSPERSMVQALIQLANARLKLRMDRPGAARRLCGITAGHLASCPGDAVILGLRVGTVAEMLEETSTALNKQYNA